MCFVSEFQTTFVHWRSYHLTRAFPEVKHVATAEWGMANVGCVRKSILPADSPGGTYMSMNCAVRQIGDVTVLDLSGRISLGEALAFGPGSAVVLHDFVRDQAANGHHKILLNLREVSYIDSCGLGDLVSCLSTVRNQGGQLRICNATTRIDDLLRITHLDAVLNFDKDEAAALQAFTKDQQKGTSAA